MGFDVEGMAPDDEIGGHFRANIWFWHPLAWYILQKCSQCMAPGEDDEAAWHRNEDFIISQETSVKIADELEKLIAEGTAFKDVQSFNRNRAEATPETCGFCEGSGTHTYGEYEHGDFTDICPYCDGTGKQRPHWTEYHFNVAILKDFATFSKHSGGFVIC